MKLSTVTQFTLLMLLLAVAAPAADWEDRFYQYRIPITLQSDATGGHTVALTPADIVTAINVHEELKFDPAWFAYNHLRAVEIDAAGQVIDFDGGHAGFTLVLDERQLVPSGALDGSKEKLDIPVEPGATYLLRYTNEGGGMSPALAFEPIFPVMHKLRRVAYHVSHEPRLLPQARTTREVLIVPNTAILPLRVKDRFVTGVQDLTLHKGRIVFDVEFKSAGEKRLMLYYQPLTGHFLTIPKRRRETMPPSQATLVQIGPAEKYHGQTRYGLADTESTSVWFAETTVKLTPDTAAPADAQDAIRISSAANEAQSFQLVLQPRRKLDFRQIRAGALVGPSARIQADAMEVRRIDYVPITEPSYLSPVSYRGRLADPLVEAKAQPLSPIDGNACYWLTVRTPPATPAGTYRGALTLDLGDEQIELPLELEVYDFELPEFSPFRSSMGGAHITKVITDEKTVADYHGITSKADIKKLARAYYDEMARHKFTPHSVVQYSDIGMNWSPPPAGFNVDKPGNHFALHDWDFTELNRDLAHYINELKVNAFTLVHIDPTAVPIFMHLPGAELDAYNRVPPFSSLGWQTFREITWVGYDKREQDDYIEITKAQFDHLVLNFYRAFAENLEQHGWLDYACILVDETAGRGYEPYLSFLRLLKSDPLTARIQHIWCLQGPAAFHYKTDPADADYAFNNLLDIYMPETNENHHFWEKYYFTDFNVTPAREKLWNYITYTTRVAIDTPGINNRAIAMEVFNNGGGGFLIWGTFIWDSERHHESNHDNPWEQPWTRWGNGAMAYFYPPHKAGPVSEPDFTIIPSLRIETYRESVDDFEYAWMLENRIASAGSRGRDVSQQQAVLDDIERFFVGPVHWSQNDAWYLELRHRMARAIEQLKDGS